MYLLNELLISAPAAVYACLRIRRLIGPRLLKDLWVLAFLAVAAGYPAAEKLSHGAATGWGVRAAVFAGYCALPLYLYVILTVIAVDLAAALLRAVRPAWREALDSPRGRARRLAVCLTLPFVAVILGTVNHSVLRVREYRIELPARSAAPRELTVVFMSDLHFRDLTPDRLLEDLTAKVNARKPDLILVGGDMLEGDRRGEDTARYERAFRRMTSTYGIYGVPGNHERFSRAGRDGFLERAGIRLLEDEIATVDGVLALAGRQDSRAKVRKRVSKLLAEAPGDLPLILLSHRPKSFDEARRAGAGLQLSGHTHHGQLFPVNLITAMEYDLSWGHLERSGAHLIVTSGVQGWGPPVRTVGASEIVVIRLVLK